ncbi:MAG TPA: aldo/keto reductase [Bauldia sp.]|nr:aldo/keto reductase [Bauldia sp.]
MKASDKRRLGRVDLDVTVLSLGTVAIGNLFKSISELQASETFEAAWDAGIRYYDTAPLYGHGLGELRTGAALRLKPRDSYVLSSKVGRLLRPRPRKEISFGGWVDVTPFELVYDYSYDGTMRAFEDSLQRLALERMDICFIHDIDVFTQGAEQPEVFRQAMDGSYRALERLRSEGMLKAIGVGVNEWEVCEAALQQRDFDCFLLAGRYSLLEQGSLKSFLPLCVERNISVVIGGGFNSGILASGAVEGARYNYGPAPEHIMDRVRRIETVCRDHRVPLQSAAMQFVTAHPAIASLIVGARSPEQMRQNVEWFQAPIPTAFWEALRREGIIGADAPVP